MRVLVTRTRQKFVDGRVFFGEQFFAYFFFKRVNLVHAILFKLILWKLLFCECLSIQTLVDVNRYREWTAPNQDNWLMAGRVLISMSCKLFPKPERHFFASMWFCVDRTIEIVLKFWSVMSFFAWQVSFQKIYYAFAEKPDKIFSARPKKKDFCICG